jgi:hypothetical protein
MNLARQTLQMALQAPGKDGAFQCIAVPHGNGSSVSWAAGDGSGGSTVHGFLGFDMSWTGYWMLRWRAAGLPGSEGTVDRCARLAAFLIARQEPDGLLPTRFDADGAVERDAARMLQAETAPVALFLLELYKASPKSEYLTAARKGLAFLDREVVASRKWYDFETYAKPRRSQPATQNSYFGPVSGGLAPFRRKYTSACPSRWVACAIAFHKRSNFVSRCPAMSSKSASFICFNPSMQKS